MKGKLLMKKKSAMNAESIRKEFIKLFLEVNEIQNELTCGKDYDYDRGLFLVERLTELRDANTKLDCELEKIVEEKLKDLTKYKISGVLAVAVGVLGLVATPFILPYSFVIAYASFIKHKKASRETVSLQPIILDIDLLDMRMFNYVEMITNKEFKQRIIDASEENDASLEKMQIALDLIDYLLDSEIEITINISDDIKELIVQILQEDLGSNSNDLDELIRLGKQIMEQENRKSIA